MQQIMFRHERVPAGVFLRSGGAPGTAREEVKLERNEMEIRNWLEIGRSRDLVVE